MRRFSSILLCIAFISNVIFGITNFYLNGASVVVIEPPEVVEFTGDFSSTGATVFIDVYFDDNNNGLIEYMEYSSTMGIIDGVPSIGWFDEDNLIPGDDDTLIDGDFYHSHLMEFESNPFLMIDTINVFYVARDAGDGSADTALMRVVTIYEHMEAETPYIFGYVKSSADSTPIGDALCMAFYADGDDDEKIIGVFSDSTGRFTIELSDTGTFTVIPIPLDGIHLGKNTIASIYSTSDSFETNIYCDVAESRVLGSVTSDLPGPLPDFLMVTSVNETFFSISATLVDPSTGDYVLPVFPGEAEVMIGDEFINNFSPGTYIEPSEWDLMIPTTGDLTGIDFVIHGADAVICGTLFDSTSGDLDLPMGLIRVAAYSGELGNQFEAVTDPTGGFSILVKGGYAYHVHASPYNALPSPYAFDSIFVDTADTLEANFVLRDLTTMPVVRGRITDMSGDPVEDAYVIAHNDDLEYLLSWQLVMSDSAGYYSLLNLPPWYGKWKLGAYKSGYGLQTPRLYNFDWLPEDSTLENMDIQFSGTFIWEQAVSRAEMFDLGSVYPNPFNSVARINIMAFDDIADIDVSLYNILGGKIETFYSGFVSKGKSAFSIDLDDRPSGIYLLKVRAGKNEQRRTLILKK